MEHILTPEEPTEFNKWRSRQEWPIGTCAIWIKPICPDKISLPGVLFALITESELIALRKLIEVDADDASLHHTSGVAISINGRAVGSLWCARNATAETMKRIEDDSRL